MALPLKSGADLYNNQALRMRLHNLGADPTEVGAGLIYFNTSTGLNTSQKARLYTGSAWKTIAFSEDLDVASNADFLALKDKVDTLIGDGVDMDGIIESWKEVEAFLSGMSDTKSLMDLLNGKLNTSGGTITGNIGALKIKRSNGNSSAIHFQNIVDNKDNDLGGLGFGNDGKPYVFSPDYSTKSEILTSAGGTISGNLTLESYLRFNRLNDGKSYLLGQPYNNSTLAFHDGSAWKTIAFTDSDITGTAAKAKSLVDTAGDAVAYVSGNTFYIGDSIYPTTSTQILGKDIRLRYGANASFGFWLNESGNVTIGEQDYAGTDAKLYVNGGIRFAPRTIWGQSFDGTGDVSGNLILNNQSAIHSYTTSGTSLELFNISSNNNLSIGYSMAGVGSSYIYGNEIYLRYGSSRTTGLLLNSSGNVTIGASDLAGSNSKLFVDGHITIKNNGNILGVDTNDNVLQMLVLDNGNDLVLGYGTSAKSYSTYLEGNTIYFRRGPSHTTSMLINSSGNVTIGGSDLAGTGAKLYVDGNILLKSISKIGAEYGDTKTTYNYIEFNSAENGLRYYGGTWATNPGKIGHQFIVSPSYNAAMTIYNSGNILIGTTDDKGQKLQVNGNAKLDGYLRANTIYLNRDSDGIEAFEFSNVAGTNGLAIKALGGNAFLSFWTNTAEGVTEHMRINGRGNVGIGTSNPTEKLHVVGNLHVTGNIIADGEVSAGGAAEEGGNAGGGGAFHSEGIAVGATQTTIAHGLGTDDIVVSIYEKDGVSGRWSIILTDVEIVDANNIIVSFGSATTVEHKVVIMGAVA